MGQTAFTVRMDSDVKKQFDELCKDFGMSSNTAFNVFARAARNFTKSGGFTRTYRFRAPMKAARIL